MPRLRAMKAAFEHQARHFLSDPGWLIPNIIAPFVITLVALTLYNTSEGPVVMYAILGGGMMGMWGNTLYASGFSIQSERWWGTLESTLAVPTPLIWIIAGRTLWNALIGIVNGLAILVIAVFLLDAPLTVDNVGLFLLAFLITLLSLAALGLVFSSAFVLTRQAGVLTNGLEFPIYVATGCLFPIAILPLWSSPFSLSLAPTWGIDSIRIAAGYNPDGIWDGYLGYLGPLAAYAADLAVVMAMMAAYILAALYLFKRVEVRARIDGSLGRV
jgi:ABC-2 type transport system permease protein